MLFWTSCSVRQPFFQEATSLMAKVERQEINGYLCATTVTTIDYLVTRAHGSQASQQSIRKLLSIYEVATVNRAVLDSALQTGFSDFEDAVLHESARLSSLDAIVTRNVRDFRNAVLPVYLPNELLTLLTQTESTDDSSTTEN
ncbi:MAG: PIN domain-containing protein [Caldilineaceae bacterium]